MDKNDAANNVNDAGRSKGAMIVWSYVLIVLGCFLYAVGFRFFMFPNSIVSGGLTGIAMIINKFTGLPIGTMVFAMNLPLFAYAWKKFGRKFIIASFVGTLLSSAFVDLLALTGISATDDAMLAAIIGGVIKGAGMGIIYYAGGTTGGIDIVVKLLRRKYFNMNFGTIMLALDACIIAAYALAFRIYESAMYAVIAIYVTSKVIDVVLYGFDISSIFYIISEKCDEIAGELVNGLHRGVTFLDAEGAYSHRRERVIMSVLKKTQIADARRMIRKIDPNAFVIVTDAKNVFGRGFDDIIDAK